MRASTIVVAALSALAMAAPVDKRAYVTDIVVEYVYVTVTEGQPLPTSLPQSVEPKIKISSSPVPVVVIPIPTPTPTPTPEVVVPEIAVSAQVVAEVSPQATVVEPTPAPVVSVAPQVPAVGAVPSDGYKSAVLYHHNVHRANHNAPALTYNDELAGYAATVAAKCVFGHDLTPGGGGYGQNIANTGSTASDESSKDPNVLVAGVVSNMWYNDELPVFLPEYYGLPTPAMGNFEKWGHFSQVVWKSTTSVGCATQFCSSGTQIFPAPTSGWFTVCNYAGPGNMGGEYGNNVGAPLGQATVSA